MQGHMSLVLNLQILTSKIQNVFNADDVKKHAPLNLKNLHTACLFPSFFPQAAGKSSM